MEARLTSAGFIKGDAMWQLFTWFSALLEQDRVDRAEESAARKDVADRMGRMLRVAEALQGTAPKPLRWWMRRLQVGGMAFAAGILIGAATVAVLPSRAVPLLARYNDLDAVLAKDCPAAHVAADKSTGRKFCSTVLWIEPEPSAKQ